MKTHRPIVLMSIFSIVLLAIAFIFLISLGPLEQNQTLHSSLSELLSKDPKVQRDAEKGIVKVDVDQTATDILLYLDQYKKYPLLAIGFSIILNIIALAILKSKKNLAASLLIVAAIASFFTFIPAMLQVIAGAVLIKLDVAKVGVS